jgi:hypothetical protein
MIGDDRWPVEESQRDRRIPNEDAFFSAFGAEGQAEGRQK